MYTILCILKSTVDFFLTTYTSFNAFQRSPLSSVAIQLSTQKVHRIENFLFIAMLLQKQNKLCESGKHKAYSKVLLKQLQAQHNYTDVNLTN